jgi:hypothetical protein
MENNEEKLEQIIKKLDVSDATNREILKSVKFIRHYFMWQSVYSAIKIVFIMAIVVLGVISWRSIAENLLKIYG